MKYFYYNIIPLTRIPLNRNPSFTYESKEKFSWGSLVTIPFGKKQLEGIVFKKQSQPKFKTKKIIKIKTIDLINKKQLSLAKKISDYYFTPLGIVLKFFTFNITQKTVSLNSKVIPQETPITLTKSQKDLVQKISSSPPTKKNLIFGPASSGKTEIAMSLIEKNLKNQKQALVILPEIFLSYQEIYRYQKRFSNQKVALLHSQLKPSEVSTIWKNIKSGKIDILISTKIGCFMPFKKLGIIIIDEEQDISHKSWDQNPKYHVEKVSYWLTQQTNSKLVFLSATPSIKNYWKAKNLENNWQLLKLPSLKTQSLEVLKPKIKILNLWEKSYQKIGDMLFSQELLEGFRKNLKKNKTALILVPYHGKSQAIFCENCKTALKCPKCKTSLIHAKDCYQCLHCNYKISSLSNCPDCKSCKLKNIGFGTESVAAEIKRFFPQSKTTLISKSNFQKNTSRKKLFKDIRENKIDFLVGNQTIAKGFDFPNINLVAVLNAQRWTGKADFKFDERWLGGFFQIGGRLNRPHSDQKGILYIQTFKSNLDILDNLKKWDWEKFIQTELKNRKALGYPPFTKLYRLTIRDVNKKKIEKMADKVYNDLQSCLGKRGMRIFQPYYSFVEKKGFFWNKHILIKIFNKKSGKAKLKEQLKKLSSKNWTIDPDPENIF